MATYGLLLIAGMVRSSQGYFVTLKTGIFASKIIHLDYAVAISFLFYTMAGMSSMMSAQI